MNHSVIRKARHMRKSLRALGGRVPGSHRYFHERRPAPARGNEGTSGAVTSRLGAGRATALDGMVVGACRFESGKDCVDEVAPPGFSCGPVLRHCGRCHGRQRARPRRGGGRSGRRRLVLVRGAARCRRWHPGLHGCAGRCAVGDHGWQLLRRERSAGGGRPSGQADDSHDRTYGPGQRGGPCRHRRRCGAAGGPRSRAGEAGHARYGHHSGRHRDCTARSSRGAPDRWIRPHFEPVGARSSAYREGRRPNCHRHDRGGDRNRVVAGRRYLQRGRWRPGIS